MENGMDPVASGHTNLARSTAQFSVNSQDGTFPLTRYSVILAAQSDDPVVRVPAIEAIAVAYWRPLYKYVRMKWNVNSEDAADFTQEFFARLLEKEFFNSYDARKGRLRTFLRTCADRLFMNQMRDSKRLKRGGSAQFSLDFADAERELGTVQVSESPEARFDQEWVRSLFALGLQRLQHRCESAGKII